MKKKGKTPASIDEEQRDILSTLQMHLGMFGDANDAEDHDFLADAEQERKDACASIQELISRHTFLVDLLPTLQDELDSGHIMTFGWSGPLQKDPKQLL